MVAGYYTSVRAGIVSVIYISEAQSEELYCSAEQPVRH